MSDQGNTPPHAKAGPSTGSQLALPQTWGRFKVLQKLGEGGMGEVFLAEDLQTKKRVALKTVFKSLMEDTDVRNRFAAEAKTLGQVSHPNVVGLIDWGIFKEGPYANGHYMAMEYIDGVSLHSLIRQHRLSLIDMLAICREVAVGLAACHRANIIHRDLKPANVMIDREGRAKIIDFGIARPASFADGGSDERGFRTKTGIVIGTVNYLAPELLAGAVANPRTDVYALGLLIYEVFAGTTPFKSESSFETMKKVAQENLSWPEPLVDVAPPGLFQLVAKLSAKKPERRPQSADEVTADLEKIMMEPMPVALSQSARFDRDYKWSPSVLEKLKNSQLRSCEFAFVLTRATHLAASKGVQVEITQRGALLDEKLIDQAIQDYQRARQEAAQARANRIKVQAAANVGMSLESSAPKLNPLASAQHRMGSSGPHAIGTPPQGVAASFNFVPWIVAMSVVGAVLGGGLWWWKSLKATGPAQQSTQASQTPSNSTDRKSEPSARPRRGATEELLTEARPVRGAFYSYRILGTSAAGVPVSREESRVATTVLSDSTVWSLDSQQSCALGRFAIPSEAFCNPLSGDFRPPASIEGNPDGLFPLETGKRNSFKIRRQDQSQENINCGVLGTESIEVSGRGFITHWKIECTRFSTDNITRHEVYWFAPGFGSWTKLEVKTTMPPPASIVGAPPPTVTMLTYSLIGFNTP
ncbi:MAG TPA: serine/threonine-protein kinase [Pseudobdellovibrionaceae bacterium]|nr:serine/threonine-protein kinase [Pseudobdellovibrionaceae bacterium]